MLYRDGSYRIYVIKHVYHDKKDRHGKQLWSNSGDCGQFFNYYKDFNKNQELFKKFKEVQRPFTACGRCWQETGVKGSYEENDAYNLLLFMIKQIPAHRFGIFVVEINQKTNALIEGKMKAGVAEMV